MHAGKAKLVSEDFVGRLCRLRSSNAIVQERVVDILASLASLGWLTALVSIVWAPMPMIMIVM